MTRSGNPLPVIEMSCSPVSDLFLLSDTPPANP